MGSISIDGGIDHILVDEARYARPNGPSLKNSRGVHKRKRCRDINRTIFVVGDKTVDLFVSGADPRD